MTRILDEHSFDATAKALLRFNPACGKFKSWQELRAYMVRISESYSDGYATPFGLCLSYAVRDDGTIHVMASLDVAVLNIDVHFT